MTQTQNKYEQLQKIEIKAWDLANKAIINNRFSEVMENHHSHLNATRRKWEKLMSELRGWADYQGSEKTNTDWYEYCRINNLCIDYNFGDVIA